MQGGYENLEIARSYYAQAAKLNPNNIRAVYGLILVILFLSFLKTKLNLLFNSFRRRFTWLLIQSARQKKKESIKLAEWASSQLQEQQASISADGSNKLFSAQILQGLINNLQIVADNAKN